MNLILTTRCAKGCSFCFTDDDDKKNNIEMDISNVKKLMDNFYSREKGPTNLKLLGGEPTQYSKFPEALSMALAPEYNQYERTTLLVSNILFNSTVLKTILDTDVDRKLSLLVNGMELDEYNRINLFKHNITELGKVYDTLSIAITLADNKSLEYHKKYIEFLDESGVINSVSSIRLGIDLSNTNIINNKKYGEIIKAYFELALKYNVTSHFDCQIPPCVFESNEIKHLIDIGFISPERQEKTFNCFAPPLDIMPDLKTEFCYQTIGIIAPVLNILDYTKLLDLKNDMMDSYEETHKKINQPDECLNCEHYDVLCRGLCVGCGVK